MSDTEEKDKSIHINMKAKDNNNNNNNNNVNDDMKSDSSDISSNNNNNNNKYDNTTKVPGVSEEHMMAVNAKYESKYPYATDVSPKERYLKTKTKLGSGATKKVYLGIDTATGQEVAWNVVPLSDIDDDGCNKVWQEVTLLQKLHHDNIVEFYDMWRKENERRKDLVFLTQKYAGTLKDYITKMHPVRETIIRKWCIQILKALEYLHTQQPPIIHRDLKADNIFIDTDGNIRIGDFGLSIQSVRARTLQGTPGFLAPELFNENYNELVDIFAFGMCVMEMVTNEYPFQESAGLIGEILKKGALSERPEALKKIQNEEIVDLIEKCMQPVAGRPSARFLLDSHPFLNAANDAIPQRESENPYSDVVTVTEVESTNKAHVISITMETNIPNNKKIAIPDYNIFEDRPPDLAKELVTTLDLDVALVPVIENVLAKHVSEYKREQERKLESVSESEIAKLLHTLGISNVYAANFIREEVTVNDLAELTEEELVQLVPKLGPRKRLKLYITNNKERLQQATLLKQAELEKNLLDHVHQENKSPAASETTTSTTTNVNTITTNTDNNSNNNNNNNNLPMSSPKNIDIIPAENPEEIKEQIDTLGNKLQKVRKAKAKALSAEEKEALEQKRLLYAEKIKELQTEFGRIEKTLRGEQSDSEMDDPSS